MGNRVNRQVRGFGVLDIRHTADALTQNIVPPAVPALTDSTYNERQPRQGSALAMSDLAIVTPTVHGAQTEDLELLVVRGGDNGGWTYRDASDTTEADYRSWNEHVWIGGFRALQAPTTTEAWILKAMVSIPTSGDVVLVSSDSLGPPNVVNSAWIRSAVDRSWSARISIDTTGTGWIGRPLGLVRFDDKGTLIAFNISLNGTGRAFASDDDGGTWSPYAEDIAPGTAFEGRLVAGVDALGNVLAVKTDSATGDLERWVSTDRCHSFELAQTESAVGLSFPSLSQFSDGTFLLTYVRSNRGRAVRMADAFDPVPVSFLDEVDITPSTAADLLANDPEHTSWVDDDDVAYFVGMTLNDTQLRVWRSLDRGTTWEEYSTAAAAGNLFTTTTLRNLVSTATQGEAVVVHGVESTPGGETDALWSSTWGGWTNVEHNSLELIGSSARLDRAGWGGVIAAVPTAPFGIFLHSADLFQNQGTVHVGAATTIDVDGVRYSTAGGVAQVDTVAWTRAGTDLLIDVEVKVDSGGSLASDDVGVELTRRDGALETIVFLRFDTTGFALHDSVAGGPVLGTVLVPGGLGTHVQVLLVSTDTRELAILWRRPGDVLWSLGPTTTTLATNATVSTAEQARILHTTTAVATSHWRLWGIAQQGRINYTLTVGTWWGRLAAGKALAGLPYPTPDLGSTALQGRLAARGGPARRGEAFLAATIPDGAVQSAFPLVEPSPAVAWETADDSEQRLVLDYGQNTRLGPSWCWVFALIRPRLRLFEVEVKTSAAGAWTTLFSGDIGAEFSGLTYARRGDIVAPAMGTAAGARFLRHNELAGGMVTWTAGGASARVLGNTSGFWTDANTQRAQLRIEVLGGEPTAGADLIIIPPRAVVVVPQSDDITTNTIRYSRITIPNQPVVTGRFRVGAYFAGSLLVPGRQFGRGYTVAIEPNTRTREDDRGTQYVDQRGPPRRRITVSWQDGSNLQDLRKATAPEWVDYLAASDTTAALAADRDVLWQLQGLMTEARSGELPLVMLLATPETPSLLTDPDLVLYGRMAGSVQGNHVLGDEVSGEVWRVESRDFIELV